MIQIDNQNKKSTTIAWSITLSPSYIRQIANRAKRGKGFGAAEREAKERRFSGHEAGIDLLKSCFIMKFHLSYRRLQSIQPQLLLTDYHLGGTFRGLSESFASGRAYFLRGLGDGGVGVGPTRLRLREGEWLLTCRAGGLLQKAFGTSRWCSYHG